MLTSWPLWACAVAGLTATWLLRNAYHAGPLAAAQPGVTLLDPLVATCWGVLAFGERVYSGSLLWLVVLPAAAVIGGVAVLSRSPALQHAAGQRSGAAKRGPTPSVVSAMTARWRKAVLAGAGSDD